MLGFWHANPRKRGRAWFPTLHQAAAPAPRIESGHRRSDRLLPLRCSRAVERTTEPTAARLRMVPARVGTISTVVGRLPRGPGRRGQTHVQERERPACAVQLGPPLDDKTARLVEAAGRRVLLVDIDGQLALEFLGVPDQPPAAAATMELRGEEQRLHLAAGHS